MRKIVFLLLIINFIFAKVLVVDKDTDNPCVSGDKYYTSIQDAMDKASNGDTIKVCSGTYNENIDWKQKNITLEGASGNKDDVKVSASSGKDTIYSDIDPENVIIKHITFKSKSKKGIYFDKQLSGKLIISDINVTSEEESLLVDLDIDNDVNISNSVFNSNKEAGIHFKGNLKGNLLISDINITSEQESFLVDNEVGKNVEIKDSFFHSNNEIGVYFNENVKGNLTVFDVNITSEKESFRVDNKIDGNVDINNTDFKSNKETSLLFKGSIGGDVNLSNSIFNSDKKKGIYFDIDIKGNLKIYDVNVSSKEEGFLIDNGANGVEIKYSEFNSTDKDGIKLKLDNDTSVEIKNNCFKTEDEDSYGLTLDMINSDDVHINNNCFYGKDVEHLACTNGEGYDWDSNYWDGFSGDKYENNDCNIEDDNPLSSCPNDCSGENSSSDNNKNGIFNAVDYIESNCNAVNDWDNNITTKIVNKDFNLTILAKDKDLNTPLEANITKVDFYEYNTNDCSGSYNIENICTNCGQTSEDGCLAVSDIKIDKAVKCIKVHIEGNVSDDIQDSNSTDNFAVRPNKFVITDIPSKIIAGKEFNITLKALDYENNPSKDYNESVNINGNSPDLEYNISKNNCDNGDLKIVNGGDFKNGETNVTLKYNEVGDMNLTLKEVNGSEFALVDSDDTSLNNRLILAYKTQISVNPDHFKVNANFSNYDNNFTYLDNDLNLYSVLDINITAENENNETTKNYNKDCYAKDIDINISKIFSPESNLDNLIYFYKDAKNKSSEKIIQDINKTIQIHYIDTNFTTDNNGSTEITLFINFDRNSSHPINPFDMNITEINVSDGITNGKIQKIGKALYYYGNLVLFDEIANKNEFDTRDNYFIVYDSNESDDKLPSNNAILPDWYLNSFHKSKDGNISNIIVSSDYNASNQINGVEVSVNSIDNGKVTFHIKRNDTSINFAVLHLLEPNLKWLWYSKYGDEYNISNDSTCLKHFCFAITWKNNNEKGIIKSGEVKGTESNVTDNNITKRGVKIFR